MNTDERFMQMAIDLALKGSGYVNPNPRVGCVIVHNGEVVGKGYHTAYGKPHAEIEAIADAERRGFNNCSDAEIYVNLEPCSHQGKTPPCAPELIAKRFKRVIIGMIDPFPEVAGRGVAMLRAAGIDVSVGVLEDKCRWINRFFINSVFGVMPYMILKAGMSLDGNIATRRGESQWITCEESRRRSHLIRAEVDAVMVGKTTALKDNPRLDVRGMKGRSPKRVILDTKLSLPPSLNVFKDEKRHSTIICCSDNFISKYKVEVFRVSGVKVQAIESGSDGRIDMAAVLKSLFREHNIKSVLVEGGATLFSSLLRLGLANEIQTFIAPILIGDGLRAFSDLGVSRLIEAFHYDLYSVEQSGSDIHAIVTAAEHKQSSDE